MSLLVTGVGGFIGSAIAARAFARGQAVVGVGRNPTRGASWPVVVADLASEDLVDVLNEHRVEAIVHAAGAASVGCSFSEPALDLRASVGTFAPVLDAARRAKNVPRVVFPSSAAVYGSVEGSIQERQVVAPVSPYGFHKAACELLAREYRSCFNVPTMVARIFSAYGPSQRRLLLWEVYEQAQAKGEVLLQGTGTEERDYLHVDDLADAILDVLGGPTLPPVVNLATGSSITTRDLGQTVLDVLGYDGQVGCLGRPREGDPARWRADVSELRRHCTRAFRTVREGVAECVAYWERERASRCPPDLV